MKFFNAVDRAYKRKIRENKKVNTKNNGIYRKNNDQIKNDKRKLFRKIANKPDSILTLYSMPYIELEKKMLSEEKPTYEAIPYMVSYILRSNAPSHTRLYKLRRMIAGYSDKGINSKHLKNDRQLERSLIAGESFCSGRRNSTRSSMKRFVGPEYIMTDHWKKIISKCLESNSGYKFNLEKIHRLFEYIINSYIQGRGIFSSKVMTNICGSNYKKYLEFLETAGL